MSNRPPSSPADPDDHNRQLELGDDDSSVALRKAWERTLRGLTGQFNGPTIENWLKPLRPLSWDNSVVVLGAPSRFAREWVEKKYTQVLRTALATHLDAPNAQVRFVTFTPDVQPLLGEKPLPLQQAASPKADLSPARVDNSPSSELSRNPFALELAAVPLNDRYTFAHFVEGKSNRLAFAGAQAVARAPGTVYNPLFIYGNPGLGKTHMMHAIGHAVRESLPQARIAYVSGEAFTNHYVQAVRDRRTEDFRRAYRSVDVWLVDDIQTIASKEQTKEEFFHTFNVLYQMNRQIVITSDRSPRDLRTMDDRLRSRFEAGLIADIAPPELEMREAILQKKARLENLLIPDEVIAFMADLIQSNIRALEGALIKLMAYASLARSPVTKQLARDVLSSYFVERLPSPSLLQSAHPEDHAPALLPAPRSASPTVNQIVDAVAAQMSIPREQILAGGARAGRSNKLQGDAGYARQVAMYLARDISGLPVTTLAVEFGCKNRTAVTHAHNRVQEDIASDANVQAAVVSIRRVIAYNMEE